MTSPDTIRLLEIEPDLARFLRPVDREAIGQLESTVAAVPSGELNLAELLLSHQAFAAIIVDGMVVRRIAVSEVAALRLLGPGDLLGAPASDVSMLILDAGLRVAVPTRVALLGRDFLLAAHRAPRLVAGLQARGTAQADRVALQLAICQLPRVEDRVLSVLWLLAESWGHVTADGTALRLRLTHETIGGLVGARRSTVTLALGQLTDEGAIARQDEGWLLLQPPPVFEVKPDHSVAPAILEPLEVVEPAAPLGSNRVDVLARVQELREVREELARVRQLNADRSLRDVTRAQATRERSVELRRQARERRGEERLRSRFHHQDGAGDALGGAQGQDDDAAAEGLSAPVDRVED